MLKKFAPFRVPQTYYFRNPENRWKIEGKSLQDLIQKVRLYRAQNEFPELEFLDSVIEHYLCTRPENLGACESRGPLKRGLIPSIKGGILLLTNMMYNRFVSQEVADARSDICKDCSLNVFPDAGPFVKWANNIAENSVGDRRTKNHELLGICDGCQCPLRSKCFWEGEIDLKEEAKIKMAKAEPNCWQLNS